MVLQTCQVANDCLFRQQAVTLHYARRGFTLGAFYDLDRGHSDAETAALLACDAIHLSGGNTTNFLARVRRSGMLENCVTGETVEDFSSAQVLVLS